MHLYVLLKGLNFMLNVCKKAGPTPEKREDEYKRNIPSHVQKHGRKKKVCLEKYKQFGIF